MHPDIAAVIAQVRSGEILAVAGFERMPRVARDG
jgi:hypothetical protein